MSETDTAAETRRRYNRLAPVYDTLEAGVERLAFRGWREHLWDQIEGGRVLEVGVGTGKNMPYYPEDARVVAVDLSERMIIRARRTAKRLGTVIDLCLMDAQRLALPDDWFDSAVATFVFCSVPAPVAGLSEVARVVKPRGSIILLEHVRVNAPLLGSTMDLLDPLVVRVMGAHINRVTTENVKKAGLEIEAVEELAAGGLVKLIMSSPTHRPRGSSAL